MRKNFTGAAIAASLVGGMAIGSTFAPPMAVFAADKSTETAATATARTPGQWVTDTLKGLVDKGTITQDQSTAVAKALEDARPDDGGHMRGRGGVDLDAAATALGISSTDLRTALATKSLATIAKEKNVDVQKVIDALVKSENDRLTQAVTDGKLTQEQADARKAEVTQRVTDIVNRTVPVDGRGPGGMPGGMRGGMHDDGDDDASTGSSSSSSSSNDAAAASA